MKIINRYTQLPLFENDADTMRQTVLDAVQAKTNLNRAYLQGADLQGADLQGAYLRGADLQGADLQGADLQGADLQGADLQGADLQGAKGVYVFGPIGNSKRIGYAVYFKTGAMFKLGCHWENLKKTKAAIVNDYGAKSLYEKQIVLANSILLEQVKNG